jgi:hypothetical protein
MSDQPTQPVFSVGELCEVGDCGDGRVSFAKIVSHIHARIAPIVEECERLKQKLGNSSFKCSCPNCGVDVEMHASTSQAESEITRLLAIIEGLEKERDAVDWGIRQLRNAEVLSMRQMILVLRMWSDVIENGGARLTDDQITALQQLRGEK